MRRTLNGAVIGRLALSFFQAPPGGPVVEPSTTWARGLMFKGWTIRLTPWRRSKHETRYLLAGPAVLIAWRV